MLAKRRARPPRQAVVGQAIVQAAVRSAVVATAIAAATVVIAATAATVVTGATAVAAAIATAAIEMAIAATVGLRRTMILINTAIDRGAAEMHDHHNRFNGFFAGRRLNG